MVTKTKKKRGKPYKYNRRRVNKKTHYIVGVRLKKKKAKPKTKMKTKRKQTGSGKSQKTGGYRPRVNPKQKGRERYIGLSKVGKELKSDKGSYKQPVKYKAGGNY